MTNDIGKYGKFIAQVSFTAVAALVAALVDDQVDTVEWINAGIMTLGAVSVLGGGEFPEGVWSHVKTYISAITAGLVLLVSFVNDGMTSSEWLQVALAAAAAMGVAAVPGPKVYDAESFGRHAAKLT